MRKPRWPKAGRRKDQGDIKLPRRCAFSPSCSGTVLRPLPDLKAAECTNCRVLYDPHDLRQLLEEEV